MKIKILITIFIICFVNSCAYKPLYKKTNTFYPHNIKIIIKSKGKYENNASIMKLLLDEKLNSKNSKDSNLKLIVSINRNVSSMGINKDLSSDALMLVIEANYIFLDKTGKLSSGKLRNTGNFNYTTNNYANIVSMEDTSKKIIKSLSSDLADLILSLSVKRKITP
tara:strand:- start:251 stop:748 length:498 start_codon:yes stop_codon:yes gene_type:complete